MKFTFVVNPHGLETNSLYALYLAKKHLNDDFIVVNSDLVFSEKMLRDLIEHKYWNLVCVTDNLNKDNKFLKVRIDDQGYFRFISRKISEASDYVLQPLYKLSKEILIHLTDELKAFISEDNYKFHVESALNILLSFNNVKTIASAGEYLEKVKTQKDLERVSQEIRSFDFDNQTIYEGDYLVKIDKVLKRYNAKKLFVVHGKAASKNPEYPKYEKQYEVVAFKDYSSNPKYEEVLAGYKLFKNSGADVIIAIGGGSCIDVAKAIKLFAKLDEDQDFLNQTLKYSTIPLIAVPTTAGSGSEATRYAVIYRDGEKISLVHDSIFPNIAIIDPTFLELLPDYHRHASFLDAFCQAIESYYAVGANEKSRYYSKRALTLFMSSYRPYLHGHPFINNRVMKCAYYAGQAINISATTAPHALSYKLTTMKNIAHGHAVSLTLPSVLEYMVEHLGDNEELRSTLTDLAAIFEVKLKDLASRVRQIIEKFELETPQITSKELNILINSVGKEGLANTPISLSKNAIKEIYLNSLLFS